MAGKKKGPGEGDGDEQARLDAEVGFDPEITEALPDPEPEPEPDPEPARDWSDEAGTRAVDWGDADADRTIATVNYVLLIAGVPSGGILTLVALVMAYLNKMDAPEWLRTHYVFQIRTVWIGLLLFVVGLMTVVMIFGVLILSALGVWVIVRSAVGLSHLVKGRPYPNYRTWMI